MFCTNCGYQFTRDVQFCPLCGKSIATIPNISQSFEEKPNQPRIDYKIKYRIGFAIGILLVILMEFTDLGNLNAAKTTFLMAVYSFCIVITYQFPPKKAVLFPVVCVLVSLCYFYYVVQILGEPLYYAKNIILPTISRYVFVLLIYCFCLIFRKNNIRNKKPLRYFIITSISTIVLYTVLFGLSEIISVYSGDIKQESLLFTLFSNLIAGIPILFFTFLFYFIYRNDLKAVENN